jgi:hypothetical protein
MEVGQGPIGAVAPKKRKHANYKKSGPLHGSKRISGLAQISE